jgi:hypothetical protein
MNIVKGRPDLEEVWEYVEPHESGGTVYVTMTKQQAINWMKEVYKDKRLPTGDEEIFNEWVTVNLAYKSKRNC